MQPKVVSCAAYNYLCRARDHQETPGEEQEESCCRGVPPYQLTSVNFTLDSRYQGPPSNSIENFPQRPNIATTEMVWVSLRFQHVAYFHFYQNIYIFL